MIAASLFLSLSIFISLPDFLSPTRIEDSSEAPVLEHDRTLSPLTTFRQN